MKDRPRTLMNGCESAVGTHPAYQAGTAKVNRNQRKLRCKKKELWIFDHFLWKTSIQAPSRAMGTASTIRQIEAAGTEEILGNRR
jgi:hypothetical protein